MEEIRLFLAVLILWGVFTLTFCLLALWALKGAKNSQKVSEIEGFLTWVFENFEYDLKTDVWIAKTGIMRKRVEDLYKIYFESVKKC